MSRRREEGFELSLDSFLNVMKIVIGVLILIVLVTVLGGGEVTVPSGAAALAKPKPSATRVLFECKDGAIFRVDEEGNAKRVKAAIEAELGPRGVTADGISLFLVERDIGDERHRVHAQQLPQGLAWAYVLRPGATGESKEALQRDGSAYRRALDAIGPDSFAYFVVHDDSFETFRVARQLAIARGVSVGWHPVEGDEPVRLSAKGSLGTRVQ